MFHVPRFMTIGLDTRLYGAQHGGIGRYTQELIIHLLKIDRQNQYVFFACSEVDKNKIIGDLKIYGNPDISDRVLIKIAPYRCYSLAEQIRLARIIKKAKIDLMHFPHFNAPLIYNEPYVVTIHDLIIHHFPDERATALPRWLYRLKLIGYKKVIKHSVFKAKAIITPSNFTKNDILRFYDIDENKVRVVYEGVDIKSKCQMSNVKPNPNVKCQNQCQNFKNYLLYVGTAYPHKNLNNLIRAFVILRQKYKLFDLKLVLVGKVDYFYHQLQKYIISQYPNIPVSNIVFYGYATDAELSQLYQNAKLFVFPSLYEGFGLPPLEAMSFGLPVVASRAASIPEVCGGAAIYFNPTDPEDIANKIWSIYQDNVLQSKLRSNGFEQIKKYSWAKMAQEILGIYKNFAVLH